MVYKDNLVSIVLPVQNSQKFLESCLFSLLTQSYSDLEIIAIDDHSTDDSLKILKSFSKNDKRLRVYSNVKRYGLKITLNRCIKKAKGKYITFMNPRDINRKDRLKHQLNFLLENPKVVAVGSQCVFIDEQKNKIGQSEFPVDNEGIAKLLIHGKSVHFESVLINRYLLPKDLLYFSTHNYPFMYADLFVKLLKYGSLANVNSYLYYHLTSPKNLMQNVKKQIVPSLTLWIKARFLYDNPAPITSLFYPLVK